VTYFFFFAYVASLRFFVQPRSATFRFNLQRHLLCKDSRKKDITVFMAVGLPALTLVVIHRYSEDLNRN
jgi:hypothetical protein